MTYCPLLSYINITFSRRCSSWFIVINKAGKGTKIANDVCTKFNMLRITLIFPENYAGKTNLLGKGA